MKREIGEINDPSNSFIQTLYHIDLNIDSINEDLKKERIPSVEMIRYLEILAYNTRETIDAFKIYNAMNREQGNDTAFDSGDNAEWPYLNGEIGTYRSDYNDDSSWSAS